jgi:hypothetical protein
MWGASGNDHEPTPPISLGPKGSVLLWMEPFSYAVDVWLLPAAPKADPAIAQVEEEVAHSAYGAAYLAFHGPHPLSDLAGPLPRDTRTQPAHPQGRNAVEQA